METPNNPSNATRVNPAIANQVVTGELPSEAEGNVTQEAIDELAKSLDAFSLEKIVDIKLARFLDQIGEFYPENLHNLIMQKVEKPLLSQILKRTGGNQVHAANILGINRNTLRKKIKLYNI